MKNVLRTVLSVIILLLAINVTTISIYKKDNALMSVLLITQFGHLHKTNVSFNVQVINTEMINKINATIV